MIDLIGRSRSAVKRGLMQAYGQHWISVGLTQALVDLLQLHEA